jgi:hypothetical protein
VIAVGEQTLQKNWRISVRTIRSFSGPSAQIFLRTSVVCIVNSFAGFTTDFFGSIPSMQSPWSIVNAPSSAPCDVIAARTLRWSSHLIPSMQRCRNVSRISRSSSSENTV